MYDVAETSSHRTSSTQVAKGDGTPWIPISWQPSRVDEPGTINGTRGRNFRTNQVFTRSASSGTAATKPPPMTMGKLGSSLTKAGGVGGQLGQFAGRIVEDVRRRYVAQPGGGHDAFGEPGNTA